MAFNLASMLTEATREDPNKPVAVLGEHTLTYGQLDALSDRFAIGLRSRGIEPGQAVAVMLPNLPQFLITYFGILKAGAVMVPMNVLLKSGEIAYFLDDSQAQAMVTWAGCAEEAAKAAAQVGVSELFVVATPGTSAEAAALGQPFEALLAAGPGDVPAAPALPHQVDPGDTAVIIYTSGTTGRPKGAELTHFQLYMNCDQAGSVFGFNPDDVGLAVLPLFHVFGLSSVLNVCIRFGGTLALVPRFEVTDVLQAMARAKVTVLTGVPTMFIALLHHPDVDQYDLSALRVAVSGGAPIPAEVIDAFERKFGVVILEGYGLTETASTATFNISEQERKVYSVGKPIWGTQVRIVDLDNTPLPRGKDHVGEVVIRGHNVLKGYFRQPEATAAAFTDGWFHTGDLGYIDDDGFLFIVDRKKELIIRGGYNVYPREVEEVLYQHPAVAEAAVIGVPDDRLGEEVAAVVALRPGAEATAEEIIAYAKERMAAYKYPRSVQFRDTLPKGPTGKILKRELKQG